MVKKIFFISGFSGSDALDELRDGIRNNQDRYKIINESTNKNVHYTLKIENQEQLEEIEIINIIWQDLLYDTQPDKLGFLEKTALFFYWAKRSFVKKCFASKNKAMISNIFINGAILLIWYLSFFIAVLDWGLKEFDISFFNGTFIKTSLSITALSFLFIKSLGINIEKSIKLLFQTKRYLTENRLVSFCRGRILDEILNVEEDEKFKIVTHSFGSVIAIDAIINTKNIQNKNFDLITLGSPLDFLSLRSEKIKTSLEKMVVILGNNRDKITWNFYYSTTDWMSPDTLQLSSDNNLNTNFKAVNLEGDEGLFEKLTNKPHRKYFYNKEIIENILL